MTRWFIIGAAIAGGLIAGCASQQTAWSPDRSQFAIATQSLASVSCHIQVFTRLPGADIPRPQFSETVSTQICDYLGNRYKAAISPIDATDAALAKRVLSGHLAALPPQKNRIFANHERVPRRLIVVGDVLVAEVAHPVNTEQGQLLLGVFDVNEPVAVAGLTTIFFQVPIDPTLGEQALKFLP